jgi:DNA mismatch repair protein MutL
VTSIAQLDIATIGQIAAGEVIERPGSVVKELVENAIDAGASRITVNIERGGLALIEVIDDGAGIAAEDLPLALRRHATSKLRNAQELESIATLGFRGEGLASIASVARTEIVSRRAGDTVGAAVSAYAERIDGVRPAASPPGTSVQVRDLFDELPVRREYLRSPSAEFNRISSWLSSFALAYPQVAFTLRHDDRDVWVMPATEDAAERLAMVFGRQAAQALLPLDGGAARALNGRLRGFVSVPGYDRPDRRMQLLFVNGRLLRSALLSGAWTSGYSTFTMTGRHAYGVLLLDLPPQHVDSNVHPTKSDVRLRYTSQVFDSVRAAIAVTLKEHARTRLGEHTASTEGPGLSFAPDSERAMRVIAQLHRTFILATDGEALLLVDQHAAHERIAYESIVAAARNGAQSEPLLVPSVVELDPVRSATIDRTLEVLREGGLEIEPFGERTYRIVATPFGYAARPFDLNGFLEDLSDEPIQRDVRERVWASLACHSVTTAGDELTVEEMETLVRRLASCSNPMHCPHGRPTMVRFDPGEIARMFKRA